MSKNIPGNIQIEIICIEASVLKQIFKPLADKFNH